MTNTTQQQQQCPPSTLLHHHHHHPAAVSFSSSSAASSPLSQQGVAVPAELLPPSATSLVNLPTLSQHMVGGDSGGGGWAYSPQHHNSNHHMFPPHPSLPSTPTSASLIPTTIAPFGGPAASPMTPSGGGSGQEILNQQQQSNGFKSRLDASNSSLAGGGVQSSCMDMGVLTSPGQPANSSPRPRILRGKRAVDG